MVWKKRHTLLILIAAIGCGPHPDRGAGIAAYRLEQWETAYANLLPFAENGDGAAQVAIGKIYLYGRGQTEDPIEAERWFRMAADQGYVPAYQQLGSMFEYVFDSPPNYVEAARWYLLGAENGDDDAQFSLGNLFEEGLGVPKDLEAAARWYRLAAEQGNLNAQYFLGSAYQYGDGVPKDDGEAAKWYREAANQGDDIAQASLGRLRYEQGNYFKAEKWTRAAAEQGHFDSQAGLGWLYIQGKGVPKSNVHAYAWLNVALVFADARVRLGGVNVIRKQYGSNRASVIRDVLAQQMTSEEIAEAQALSLEWFNQWYGD